MLVIPALDLCDGACVQLVATAPAAVRSQRNDPISIAVEWTRVGFTRLHVADLNAASGSGTNGDLVRDILREIEGEVQVGGGVNSGDDVQRLVEEGAEFVVLGARSLEEPEWLAGTASAFPGRLIIMADVHERRIVTRREVPARSRAILDVVEELNDVPLAALLVTALHRMGRLEGTDLPLMEDVAESAVHPVLAAGGVSTAQELRAIADRGVAGAIVGAALYSGALDPRMIAEEFAS